MEPSTRGTEERVMVLNADTKRDRKWSQRDVHHAFTADGLNTCWNELVADGELVEKATVIVASYPDASGPAPNEASSQPATPVTDSPKTLRVVSALSNSKESRSAMLARWTWGKEPTAAQIRESLASLVHDQRSIARWSAKNTLCLSRFERRLHIVHRMLLAFARCSTASKESSGDTGGKLSCVARKQPDTDLSHEQKLGLTGARMVLSFITVMFRRAWSSDDDIEMCGDLLEEALGMLQTLPAASLFDRDLCSLVWQQTLERACKFLTSVACGTVGKSTSIPVRDRELAIALLLELAIQLGSLPLLLDWIRVALQLTGKKQLRLKSGDNSSGENRDNVSPHTTDGPGSAPLVLVLRRLAEVKPGLRTIPTDEDDEAVNATSIFLQHVSLSQYRANAAIPLDQAAVIALSCLDRLTTPYLSERGMKSASAAVAEQVYSWGWVGWGTARSHRSPELCPLVTNGCIIQIACAERIMLLVTDTGQVYTSSYGQLCAYANASDTKVVQGLEHETVKAVACNPDGRHFLALTVAGKVYSWGAGESGRLGHGKSDSLDVPQQIEALEDEEIVSIATGSNHSVALSSEGKVYTWGRGRYGRLGHGSSDDKLVPTVVDSLTGHHVVQASCSNNDAHTLLLDERGQVWAFGDGDYGKLGMGNCETVKQPRLVARLANIAVASVHCGQQMSLVITKSGKVYTWGCGLMYRLGHGNENTLNVPTLVKGELSNRFVVAASIGLAFVIVACRDGTVLGWGRNEQGQVGTGTFERVETPTVIGAVSGQGITHVACGPMQSVVWSASTPWLPNCRLPFIMQLSEPTFSSLNSALYQVCEGLDSPEVWPPPSQEQECMAVSLLHLLALQLFAMHSSNEDPREFGLEPSGSLLASLKQLALNLATSPGVLRTVQKAAQRVLSCGVMVLLPTEIQLSQALSRLLPDVPNRRLVSGSGSAGAGSSSSESMNTGSSAGSGSSGGSGTGDDDSTSNTSSAVPLHSGQVFMVNLLVKTLKDRGSIARSIDGLVLQSPESDMDPARVDDSSESVFESDSESGSSKKAAAFSGHEKTTNVPHAASGEKAHPVSASVGEKADPKKSDCVSILTLVHQLLIYSTQKVCRALGERGRDLSSEFCSTSDASSLDLVKFFQRTLLVKWIAFEDSGEINSECDTNVESINAARILSRYIGMVCEHTESILASACDFARENRKCFSRCVSIVESSLAGHLLPELVSALCLVQNFAPSRALCPTVLKTLLRSLDTLNSLAPGMVADECTDLSWPRRGDTSKGAEVQSGAATPTPGPAVQEESGASWTTSTDASSASGGSTDFEQTIIRQEDLENNNKDGGSWLRFGLTVYNLNALSSHVVMEPSLGLRLRTLAEVCSDAKEVLSVEEYELCKSLLAGSEVGIFQTDNRDEELETCNVASVMVEVERNIALLLGMHAFGLVRGRPLSKEEQNTCSFFASEVVQVGLMSYHHVREIVRTPESELLAWYRAYLRRKSGLSMGDQFAFNIAEGHASTDSLALALQDCVARYSRDSNLCLPLQSRDHPIHEVGSVLLACMLKHSGMVPLAVALAQKASDAPSTGASLTLPSALEAVVQAVHRVKTFLIMAHQTSRQSYQELCKPILLRSLFLLTQFQPLSQGAVSSGIAQRHSQSALSRWRSIVHRVLALKRASPSAFAPSSGPQGCTSGASSDSDGASKDDQLEPSLRQERQHVEAETTGDDTVGDNPTEFVPAQSSPAASPSTSSPSLPSVSSSSVSSPVATGSVASSSSSSSKESAPSIVLIPPDAAVSASLDGRVNSAKLASQLQEITKFVQANAEMALSDVYAALIQQLDRARSRLDGARLVYELLQMDGMLPSVQHSLLCGYQGLVPHENYLQPAMESFMDGLAAVPYCDRVRLDLELGKVASWAVTSLQSCARKYCNQGATFSEALANARQNSPQYMDYVSTTRLVSSAMTMLVRVHSCSETARLLNAGALALGETLLRLSSTHADVDSDVVHRKSQQERAATERLSIVEEDGPLDAIGIELTGLDMAMAMKVGTRVVRGQDWKWANQDGNPPGEGCAVADITSDGWVRILWDSGVTNSYRMGRHGYYDLALAPCEMRKLRQQHETQQQQQAAQTSTVGVVEDSTLLQGANTALGILQHAGVCLLQTLSMSAGTHADSLPSHAVRMVCGLLQNVVHKTELGRSASFPPSVGWASLGFVRAIASSTHMRSVLSAKRWTDVLVQLVANGLNSDSPDASADELLSDLKSQVLALRFLRSVLPWDHPDRSDAVRSDVLRQLFDLLGLAITAQRPLRAGVGQESVGSLSASYHSTLAEELVCLLRCLHYSPSWQGLVNDFILKHLNALADRDVTSLSVRSVAFVMPLLAVLAVIGGVDARLRIGGRVRHSTLGTGTVSSICANNRLSVHFDEHQLPRLCPAQHLKSVDCIASSAYLIPLTHHSIGLWARLLQLSLSTDYPSSAAASAEPVEPCLKGELICHQLRLGLLKTVLVILQQPNLLRAVLASSVKGDINLAQHVLTTAVLCNPVKPCFEFADLEVAMLSVCQILSSGISIPPPAPSPAAVEPRVPLDEPQPQKQAPEKRKLRESTSAPAGSGSRSMRHSRARISPSVSSNTPPAPVQRLMEMGFSRRAIDRTFRGMSLDPNSSNVNMDLVVQRILDSSDAMADLPSTTATNEMAEESERDLSAVLEDSEDSVGEDLDVEGIVEALMDPSPLKETDSVNSMFKSLGRSWWEKLSVDSHRLRRQEDFNSTQGYIGFLRAALSVGSWVCCRSVSGMVDGSVGQLEGQGDGGEVVVGEKVRVKFMMEGLARRGTQKKLVNIRALELVHNPLDRHYRVKVCDPVRVRSWIHMDSRAWGNITHKSRGKLMKLPSDGSSQCIVSFDDQPGRYCCIYDLEKAPAIHLTFSCDRCEMSPIIGPRFSRKHTDFNLCKPCFWASKNPLRVSEFFAHADPGKEQGRCVALMVRRYMLGHPKVGKLLIADFNRCVEKVQVSSNTSSMSNLYDDNPLTFWVGAKDTRKHWIDLELKHGTSLKMVTMTVNNTSTNRPRTAIVCTGFSAGLLTEEIGRVDFAKELAHTRPGDLQEVVLFDSTEKCNRFLRITLECNNECRITGIELLCHPYQQENELVFDFRAPLGGLQAKSSDPLVDHVTKLNLKEPCHREVFVWGLNDKDQLGGVQGSKVKVPTKCQTLSSIDVTQFSGGSKCLLILTSGGRVVACGESQHGRLGIGAVTAERTIVYPPQPVAGLPVSAVVSKVDIHSGGRHALAMTTDGAVYSWGEGDDGKLGHGDRETRCSAKQIEALKSKRVVGISAGSSHSACILDNGDLYTWGMGDYGRLGHGSNDTISVPNKVGALDGLRVVDVACGSRDAQTVCCTESGAIYAWGDGDFGKLGLGGSEHCSRPMLIEGLQNEKIVKVYCGAQFSAALSSEGGVWTWGKFDFGRLGLPVQSHVRKPVKVKGGLVGKKVVQLAVGALHVLALTDDGRVYTWGDNDHGQQGNRQVDMYDEPRLVEETSSLKVIGIACGSSHCIAFAEAPPPVMSRLAGKSEEAVNRFSPVVFVTNNNPLGLETSGEDTAEKSETPVRRLRALLERNLLSQPAGEQQMQALKDIALGLQIMTARHCMIAALSKVEAAPNAAMPVSAATSRSSSPAHNSQQLMERFSSAMVAAGQRNLLSPTHHAELLSAGDMDTFVARLVPDCLPQLVSLLKLAVGHRCATDDVEALASMLEALVESDETVGESLLSVCVGELEGAVANPRFLEQYHQPAPTMQESPHPYPHNANLTGKVRIPGAKALRIEFDPQCRTEDGHDRLTITDALGSVVSTRSGHEGTMWTAPLVVQGCELSWKFCSDGTINAWGFRFTAHAVMPGTSPQDELADQQFLNLPCMHMVARMLSMHVHTLRRMSVELLPPIGAVLPRLASALAACCSLPLQSQQRVWAVQWMRRIIRTVNGGVYKDSPAKASRVLDALHVHSHCALGYLVKKLPDLLERQMRYEEQIVKSGSQLSHTPFLKAIVALCCDLSVGMKLKIESNSPVDTWFPQFCLTYHTAMALQNRTALPTAFCDQVHEQINLSTPVNEKISLDYQDNSLFDLQRDEQLLLWLKRCPDDWHLKSWWGIKSQVWAWGHNNRGQLTNLNGDKVKAPTACEIFADLRPCSIVGGDQCLLVLSDDGKVYANGNSSAGRLGLGSVPDTVIVPRHVESLKNVQIKQVSMHPAGCHVLALSNDGEVYSWGEGVCGKLGHGNRTSCDRPRVIESLRGNEVNFVAAGGSHSACILAGSGDVMTWGKGRYGRLGHGTSDDMLVPKKVEALSGHRCVCIALGSGDAQSVCVAVSPEGKKQVWSWGDADYGKLGRPASNGSGLVPGLVEDLNEKDIVDVQCGSQFTIALSAAGEVYTWGKGDFYRLGHGSDSHVRRPQLIAGLQLTKITEVAVGSLHCVALSATGEVYAWGDNDEGQLGDGSLNAASKPKLVVTIKGERIDHVACGSAHTLVWSTMRPPVSKCPLPSTIPVEYQLLSDIEPVVLRNRLILLQHFTDIFCSSLPLLSLYHSETDNVSVVANGNRSATAAHSGSAGSGATPSLDELLDRSTNNSTPSQMELLLAIDTLRRLLVSTKKESIFKKVVQATMERNRSHGRAIDINRFQVKNARVRTGNKAASAAAAAANYTGTMFCQVGEKMLGESNGDLRLAHRVWKVKFSGEGADDCGGAYSESISEMCEELQTPGVLPLLILTPNGLSNNGVNRDCFILNPSLLSQPAGGQAHRENFRFLGILIGIAIRTGAPMNLSLAPPVWKQLVGMALTVRDLEEIDRDYVPSLLHLRWLGAAGLDKLEMPYSTPSASGTEVRLSSAHASVNSDNVEEYIQRALLYRLHEFDAAVEAVRTGMSQVIPVPMLFLFTGPELEMMTCGCPAIELDLLRSVVSYKGTTEDSDLVRWFWAAMEEFSQQERSLFLRFVWGRTRLPRTLADFRGRDFVFQVMDNQKVRRTPDNFLPESYTCFFLLKLPCYTSGAILAEKLRYAIHHCKAIDLDDYARTMATEPEDEWEDEF